MKKKVKQLLALFIAICILSCAIPTVFAAEANTDAQLYDNGLSETIEGGAILHCWCWSFNTIREKLPEIAAAGFSAIQTSPISECNNGGDGSLTISGGDNWWWHYQPTDYKIGNYQLGTIDEFRAMCETAHSYGIKVIVDSVLNHTTANYDMISDNIKNLDGNPFHPMGDEREPGQNWSEVDRYEETQYDLSGLYELNTQNKAVQEYLLNFLIACVENGADGFRYDAAKLIELPDDTSEKYGSDFASDFWPTILQNGSYFQYGEVLQEGGRHSYKRESTGYNDNDSSRLGAYQSQSFTDKDGGTHYMNTTNSFTGFRIRDAIANKNLDASFITDALLPDGAQADRTVTWVESHDNYCNDSSYKELTETQQVIQGWAAIAARKDGTPLFFDRPANSSSASPWGDNKIGAEGSDMYKDPQVAAVNFFRNEMGDSPEKATNPIEGNSQVLMIERGDANKGVVIINASDKDVTINADTTMDGGEAMADGSYTDQAFKGTFTVSGGVLSGVVKAGKVAVVYQPLTEESEKESFSPAVNLSPASGYFLTETLQADVTVRSCDHAEYTLTFGEHTEKGAAAPGDVILIEGLGDSQSATLTLTGYDADNEPLATVTRTYTRWIKKDNTIVYIEPEARDEWSQFYVYLWGSAENASWPGTRMELTEQGLYRCILPYAFELPGSNGNVIFNNGSGVQFDAGSITAGQQKIYTASGQWKDYRPEDYAQPSVTLSQPSGYLLIGGKDLKAYIRNCDSAEYRIVINDDEEHALSGTITHRGSIPLPELTHLDQIAVTVTGYNSESDPIAALTQRYTAWEVQQDTIVYMEQGIRPRWEKCNVYVWGSAEIASWPGVTAEKIGDIYKLILPYQYEIPGSYGNVIFNNGSGEQFDAGRITPGQKMLYTADDKWIAYEEPVDVLLGDADDDGEVTILDATAIQRKLAAMTVSSFNEAAADADEDQDVTILDATAIQRHLAALPTNERIGTRIA